MDDELQAHEALLERLRAAAGRFDPVPPDALLAARSQLAYRRLDAELAELVFDSADGDRELAGVRSGGSSARQLSFHAGPLEVELEIVAEGEQRRLVGQCLPSTTVAVLIRRQDRSGSPPDVVDLTELTTDELGRFTARVPSGRVSLRFVWPGVGTTAETTWVDL